MLFSMSNQVSLFQLHSEIDDLTTSKDKSVFTLFNQLIDLSDFIPISFYQAYYARLGKIRDFPLEGILNAFLLKNLLGLPNINTLILVIRFSKEFREFLGFSRVPHKSQFSRFLSVFHKEIHELFHHLVDFTDDFATAKDSFLSSFLISDTTGFEFYVKENNPKFYQSILKNSKAYQKTYNLNQSFDVEKFAQSKMPKISASNSDAKLTYLNGHFGYYQKAILSTNGFGLIRDINFYNTDNSLQLDLTPQETKDAYDAKSLIPSLETFFKLHPKFKYTYFLGDSGFDADDNYAYLYHRNIMPIINLNTRNTSGLKQPTINEFGVPTCPHNPDLPMVYNGIIKSKDRADRVQFICPKRNIQRIDSITYVTLDCENPCTPSKYGRTKNVTVHHNYRFNTAMPRCSKLWSDLYKIRTVCERTIAQLKTFMTMNISKIINTKTLKSTILLAGVTQLIAFIMICKSKQPIGNLAIKTLIA